MKWTWDKFGYNVPREPSRDPELILASLNLVTDQSARVHFFPDLYRAIVTSNTQKTPSHSELIRVSRECDWDVEYYTESQWNALKTSALSKLMLIRLITSESADVLIQNGIFSLDDVSVMPPERLAAILNVDVTTADAIIECADDISYTDNEAK